ncbi:MAG: DNA cytosine methyltransferase [Acidimicrobiia bacterium]
MTLLDDLQTTVKRDDRLKASVARTITTIDLFAGAGGLSLGFHLADLGYLPVFAVEHELAAATTFERNFGCEVFAGDIEEGPVYPTADLIVGGPPCQGFSPLGRDRDDLSRARLNGLWKHFLDAVRTIRPKAFVIENVREFQRSAQFVELLHLLETDSELSAYTAAYGVLNAADYGVPQTRLRGIFVAVRDHEGDLPWPPPPRRGPDSPGKLPYRTVREAIGDLPARTTGFDPYFDEHGSQHLHFGRRPTQTSLERYRAIPPGGNRFDLMRNRPDITPACWANKPSGTTDVMGRLWWDRPSATIRTEFFKPEKGRYLHPTENRVISHREGARLQSFPDWYLFEGTKIEIARQIGNAVPPLLGAAIARYVHEHAFAPRPG